MKKGILFSMAALCFGVATSEAVPSFETYFVQDNAFMRLQIDHTDLPDGVVDLRYYLWDVSWGTDFTRTPDEPLNLGTDVGIYNFNRPGLHDVFVGLRFSDGTETIYDAPDYTVAEPNYQLPLGSIPPEKGASVPDAGSSAAMLLAGLGALHLIGSSRRR